MHSCRGLLWVTLAAPHQIWGSLPSRSSQAELLWDILSPALDVAGKTIWLETGNGHL